MRFRFFSRHAALAGLACLVLLQGCSKFDNSQSALNGPAVTAQFFNAQFKDAAGQPVDLKALRGKTVVVNFWSTWCPPCLEEMPLFNELQAQYQDKNVVFVGIAADTAENVRAYLKQHPMAYPIAVGDQAGFELSQALGNRQNAMPFTVVITAKEGIASRHFGLYIRKDIESDILKALDK